MEGDVLSEKQLNLAFMVRRTICLQAVAFLPLIRDSCISFYSTVVRNAIISLTPVNLSIHCHDNLPYCESRVKPHRSFWLGCNQL